jgi:hypothetical protein
MNRNRKLKKIEPLLLRPRFTRERERERENPNPNAYKA